MNCLLVNKVSKQYFINNVPFTVLKNLTFTINEPGLYVIHGPSGSGKTTLLNIIAGLDNPTSGKVFINNKEINNKAKNVAVIYQNNYLFSELTAFDNVYLSAYITNKNVNDEEILNYFKKYNLTNVIHKKVKYCSGGEKQRVNILRALVSNPDIVLADEPTGSLDLENTKIVLDNFYELSKKKIVIVITHNTDIFLPYAKKAFHLNNGELYETKGEYI
ncbi:MAG: ATP-binding cassette domain-containing protein [Bacilli bacterium]|jgi:ABC-type lipoprotein export system ATPase subunit